MEEKATTSKNAQNAKTKTENSSGNDKFIAAVRIRGQHDLRPEIEKGLRNLNLYQRNSCSVHKDNSKMRGMLNKVKDYVAWGEIDKETLKLLLEKRGKPSSKDSKKTKKYFRLDSPKGGFEKNGVKSGFKANGALGYRGSNINQLLRKMI